MRVLLDTCVLSELRHPGGSATVKAAVAEMQDENLFLSVLTVGEIAKGIALLAAGRRQQSLANWLNGLEAQFKNRILSIDFETAQIWGDITARAQVAGVIIPAVDGLLAATALKQGMHIMTRNNKHFEASGVFVLNPWR